MVTRTMWRYVATTLATLAVALIARVATADDESDRASYLRDIDGKVDTIASELSGFESDSDVGDLDDALYAARDVRDLVARLDGVKGDDSRAQRVVSYYPGYVDSFREAAQSLKRMKEGQRRADGVADRCASEEASLQQTIRGYVGDPDAAAADEAPAKLAELGKSLGRTWDETLGKLKDNDSELQRAAGYARFSVSEDRWSNVSSAFGYAASGMQSYWSERYKNAIERCSRLALGEKHPDIVKALDDLGRYSGNTKATVTQLKRDYNAWLRDVRTLRKFSDDHRDALREVLCKAGEYEMEAKLKEVADRWASQIASVYGTTLGQADRLRGRATTKEMAKYKGPKEVIAGLDKNLANLEKLKNYELLGSNNPAIRTKIEWGKKRHLDLQGSCTYAELEIASGDCRNEVRPGSGCRLDCVKTGSTCTIIEFKPDSEGAKAEGRTQLAMYEAGLQTWYKRDKAALFSAYRDVASCESSDKTRLELRVELVTYEMCSGTVKNELGQLLDEVTLDVVESGE